MATTVKATAPINPFSMPFLGANPLKITTGLEEVVLPALDATALEVGYGAVAGV
jgi:hypothetical protein